MATTLSLVCCTLGTRPAELRRFFESIDAGGHGVQVIVVDQSADDAARPIANEFRSRFDVVYVKSRPGLSRARNVGLGYVTGEIVAFPDDDCWYAPSTLASVVRRFEDDASLAGISGRWVDGRGEPSGHPWPRAIEPITRENVWRTAISFTLFFRASSVRGISFDPLVGAGSGTPIGSGEETLYLLHALRSGDRVVYDPAVVVHHPWAGFGSIPFRKAYGYAIGFGYVASVAGYPASFLVPRIAAPWARFVASGLKSDVKAAKYHLASGLGRSVGLAMARWPWSFRREAAQAAQTFAARAPRI